MASADRPLLIPFGTADPRKAVDVGANSGRQGNLFSLAPARTEPLRLHHGPYDFRATPWLGAASDTETRLTLIHDHLRALCGLWDKNQRLLIDLYFDFITAELDRNALTLTAALSDFDNLYHYRDWAFSALRPLPRAHISTDDIDDKNTPYVALDFAFYTGERLIGVTITGHQTATKSRVLELESLRHAGVDILEIHSGHLLANGVAYLGKTLPPVFHKFWVGEILPVSPFKSAAIDLMLTDEVSF
jgi:hypothetical protein